MTPTPTPPVDAWPVELLSVTKRHDTGGQGVLALDDVTIRFAAGSMTAVMGPSGSGKSTLLHCAAGIDRPTGGRVRIEGTDLGGLDEDELTVLRRDRMGFVFQEFNLVDALTAAQNVELPLRLAKRRPPAHEVGAALAAVGLADRATHRPGDLSGGQRQRVAIARAVITRPAVLFADEPTGALDARTSRTVLRLLRELVDRRGQTVVMVTHDPVAAAWADRVVLLADGRLVDDLPGPRGPEAIAARMAALDAREAPAEPVPPPSPGPRKPPQAPRSPQSPVPPTAREIRP